MPKPGKYVIAVSGGVDSMVLLDILSREPGLELTIAHLDHGIRDDTSKDAELVKKVAGRLGVPCVCHQVKLGQAASEATARDARYKFLRKVQQETNSKAIITAHHQDDVIETALINHIRGTGRKGFTSLKSTDEISRPLLNVSKAEIKDYAFANKIEWREDSTNADEKYLRNYIRKNIMTKLTPTSRQKLIKYLSDLEKCNKLLDSLLVKYLDDNIVNKLMDRNSFKNLPHDVAREVLAHWLRSVGVTGFDKPTIEKLVVVAKTGSAGKSFPIAGGYKLDVNMDNLALSRAER